MPDTDSPQLKEEEILKPARKVRRSPEEERQSRLAFLGTLAAGLAHEIRSPLEAIKLNAELLSEEVSCLDEKRRQTFSTRIERIRRESEQLKKTLDEFLAFARPPRMERFPTRLNDYLRELIEFIEPEFTAAGIAIVTDFQEDMYPLPLDQAQMGQALTNILTNSREAIGEHGEVRVSVRDTGETVEIRIQDNGGGIPVGDEQRIFEVFYTTKERGTGLGLGIARRVVEEHGGQLILENRPGAGATFIIRLPKGKYLEYVDEELIPEDSGA
ncbi:MAG: hypothetical protein JW909_06880 [Planctomycetes bacterium]|nr:hypothetical protein [Planctomycetota bacterium]